MQYYIYNFKYARFLKKSFRHFITFAVMKRSIKLIFSATAAVLLAIILFFFSFRNQILNKKVTEKIDRFNKNHSIHICIKNARFTGIADIKLDSIRVTGKLSDTLVSASYVTTGVKILPLIKGKIGFRKFNMEHAHIQTDLRQLKLYFKESSSNEKTSNSNKTEIDLHSGADRLLKRIFNTIPQNMILKDIDILITRDSLMAHFKINDLTLKHGHLISQIRYISDSTNQLVAIDGEIKSGQRLAELTIKPTNENSRIFSPSATLLGAAFEYKSMTVRFLEKDNKNENLKIEGSCSINDFQVEHKHLSTKPVHFTGTSVTFKCNIGRNFLELDSLSTIRIGDIKLHPYFKYSINPADSVIIGCSVSPFTIDNFYSSIPPELFPELNNIEADGNLSYRTKLIVDLKQPDSLVLESSLDDKNLKIKHFNEELYKMNSDFLYTAYEKGKPVRTFQVGPENPNFRKLQDIPNLLQRSILLAEDESFFFHNGFRLESIKYAIAQNIKQGRLFRGGSTISQQIIKNVYLSKDKTISRKLEEIILVWLIESNRLVPKSRMFEVYLNIIEWGPDVYGVNEAARFYFKKDIRRLNATECIFLASVIPSPKKFYYRFDKAGNLAPFMQEYYRFIAEKMQWRGLIATNNGDSLSALLKITGPASTYIKVKADQTDTSKFEYLNGNLEDFEQE